MSWIVFEGPDGVGKSTIIREVANILSQEGFKVAVTYEPSDSEIGKLIRDWLLKTKVEPPHVYALLFTADRYIHVYQKVMPLLRSGNIVLQERYIESTIVYQHAMGLPLEWLEILNRYLPNPDLVIVLDAEPEEILKRLKERKKSIEIFEDIEFLRKVRELYIERALKNNYIIVNTTGKTIKDTTAQILSIIKEVIKNQKSRPSTG